MTITILKVESFSPLGPAIPKPAPAAPQSVQIKPGIWQAPDGKLRTDFATGQSVAPAQKAAPVAPLPVVPNALGDGWIRHDGGPCPIPNARAGTFEVRMRDPRPSHIRGADYDARKFRWETLSQQNCGDIVAFRLIPKAAE